MENSNYTRGGITGLSGSDRDGWEADIGRVRSAMERLGDTLGQCSDTPGIDAAMISNHWMEIYRVLEVSHRLLDEIESLLALPNHEPTEIKKKIDQIRKNEKLVDLRFKIIVEFGLANVLRVHPLPWTGRCRMVREHLSRVAGIVQSLIERAGREVEVYGGSLSYHHINLRPTEKRDESVRFERINVALLD